MSFCLSFRGAVCTGSRLCFIVSLSVLCAGSSAAVTGRYLSSTGPTTPSNTPTVSPANRPLLTNSSINTTSTDSSSIPTQGWTPSPNGRGTIDIIWSCALTIFLCSWTALCLNIPPSDWSLLKYTHQKNLIACEGILGPEFVVQTALGQWVSACRSVKEFCQLGHLSWTMAHAFFADMGGYILHPADFVPFPLDAKQVHYLVKEGYVDYVDVGISKRAIDDKNKGDGMTRIITVLQIMWFVISTVARAIQDLAITTLELTTLGYIVCTLGTYYFWAHKPLDIKVPIILVPNTTMANILLKAGPCAAKPYKLTPMDFVGRDEYSWFLYWTYWFNILRKIGISFHTPKRPIDKIPDDRFFVLDARAFFILFLFQTGYAAVHIAGWHFNFPTQLERRLWHISTVYILVAIIVYWIVDGYTWHVLPALKKHWARSKLARLGSEPKPEDLKEEKRSKIFVKLENFADRLRHNSPDRDPELYVPLKAVLPVTTVAAIYCVARMYIVIEDFVILRDLPLSAYRSVDWNGFLPHL
jgi:hypothetical protein